LGGFAQNDASRWSDCGSNVTYLSKFIVGPPSGGERELGEMAAGWRRRSNGAQAGKESGRGWRRNCGGSGGI